MYSPQSAAAESLLEPERGEIDVHSPDQLPLFGGFVHDEFRVFDPLLFVNVEELGRHQS